MSLTARPGLALLALAIGGFTIGTTEFAAMGILTEIANSLVGGDPQVSIPAAGYVITFYALGVVVGAPILTVLFARMPRKQLLLLLMTIYSAGNLASAFAPNLELLVAGRFITGLAHGVFFGVGAVVGTAVVGKARRGHAVAMMMVGLTIANVVGVPLTAWIGQNFGWEKTFMAVTALGVITIAAVALFVPEVQALQGASPRSEMRALRNPPLWWGMLAGAVGFGGMFAAYSYIKPILLESAGASLDIVPIALGVFGVGMTVGTLIAGKLVDRDVGRTTQFGFLSTAGALVFFGFTMHSVALVMVGLLVIGITSQILGVAMQATLMDLSPLAPSLGASLCHSALNAGNANGAFLGGKVIAMDLDYSSLAWLGVILTLIGWGIMIIVQRSKRPYAIPEEFHRP